MKTTDENAANAKYEAEHAHSQTEESYFFPSDHSGKGKFIREFLEA